MISPLIQRNLSICLYLSAVSKFLLCDLFKLVSRRAKPAFAKASAGEGGDLYY